MQNTEIEELTKSYNSLVFQPRLDLLKTPIVKSFSITPLESDIRMPFKEGNQLFIDTSIFYPVLDTLPGKKLGLRLKDKKYIDSLKFWQSKIKDMDSDTGIVGINEINYTLNIDFYLKNIGNSLAKVLLMVQTDTLSGAPTLRDGIIDIIKGKNKRPFAMDYWEDFFNSELLQNDSLKIPLIYKPKHFTKDFKIGMHYYFIYENELGNLFDSYFWVVYENAPSLVQPIHKVEENGKHQLRYKIFDNPSERFKISLSKKSFYTFNEDESKMINEWLKDVDLEIKN